MVCWYYWGDVFSKALLLLDADLFVWSFSPIFLKNLYYTLLLLILLYRLFISPSSEPSRRSTKIFASPRPILPCENFANSPNFCCESSSKSSRRTSTSSWRFASGRTRARQRKSSTATAHRQNNIKHFSNFDVVWHWIVKLHQIHHHYCQII